MPPRKKPKDLPVPSVPKTAESEDLDDDDNLLDSQSSSIDGMPSYIIYIYHYML